MTMNDLTFAIAVLSVQGIFGALDTLYYHEFLHRLPGLPEAALELRLHAARDFVYAILFVTLPWFEWRGLWVLGLWLLLASEILITLTDFHIEQKSRSTLGGLPSLERTAHAVMAILYGAFLARFLPISAGWYSLPSDFAVRTTGEVPVELAFLLSFMGVGVFLSGVRDFLSASGVRLAAWPWAHLQGNGARR